MLYNKDENIHKSETKQKHTQHNLISQDIISENQMNGKTDVLIVVYRVAMVSILYLTVLGSIILILKLTGHA